MVLQNIIWKAIKKRRLLFLHIFLWGVFITYEVSFVYLTTGKVQTVSNYASAYAINIILFYVNVWCLNYSFEKQKKYYIYIVLLAFEFVIYIGIRPFMGEMTADWKVPVKSFFSGIAVYLYIYRAIYFMGASAAYWFVLLLLRSNNLVNKMQSRHLIQQKRSVELERNLFKAKNAYLTSQINPHLLFNTLNFIYSSLYEVSRKSAEIVVLLSDMMRYSLTEIGDDGKVELEKEVEHIGNMIELNQARFNDQLNVKMLVDGNLEIRVIPLIFLTFIENIFKHGDMSDPESPARIHISHFNNVLEFYSINKVRKININKGMGIGVENSKTRLDMAYPNCYKLKCEYIDNQYVTHLTINLN